MAYLLVGTKRSHSLRAPDPLDKYQPHPQKSSFNQYINIYIYTYVNIYIHACVCVCVNMGAARTEVLVPFTAFIVAKV